MHRTNIYLEDGQVEAVDAIARAEDVSRSEVIRRLIDAGLNGTAQGASADLAAIDASFGALAGHDLALDRGQDARACHLGRIGR